MRHSVLFSAVKQVIESKLAHSAFRYGASAFRFGLVAQGVSDHLPIVAVDDRTGLTMLSWNLLADQHLYNNFMNITGTEFLRRAILKLKPEGNAYCSSERSSLYHFFSELAQYLMKHNKDGVIAVTDALLDEFTVLANQSSLLARSRNAALVADKQRAVVDARKEIVALLKDGAHEHADEFKLALEHAVELIYHIQHKDGALRWQNRVEVLKQNQRMLEQLWVVDVCAFQECTDPDDMQSLLNVSGKSMKVLTHRINNRTTDHSVLSYDEAKFKLVGEPVKFAFDGKKPCLLAKLRDVVTGEYCIVGSMHHPGGNKCQLDELVEQVKKLQCGDVSMPFYLLGDHNNTDAFFKMHELDGSAYSSVFPEDVGTMAGSDYGHTNHAIDAVTTNVADSIDVNVCEGLGVVKPASTPIKLDFVAAAPAAPASVAGAGAGSAISLFAPRPTAVTDAPAEAVATAAAIMSC